jgi:hypothetical protein
MLRESIEEQRAALIAAVREYCRQQTPHWQRVPHLALEADGRTGYSEAYSRAYSQGYWALAASLERGYYRVYVDLATGELVNSFSHEPASDECVVLLLRDVQSLDAGLLVRALEADGETDVCSVYDRDEQAAWREKMRKHHGVAEVFTGRRVVDQFVK